jgi:hypothetical protein
MPLFNFHIHLFLKFTRFHTKLLCCSFNYWQSFPNILKNKRVVITKVLNLNDKLIDIRNRCYHTNQPYYLYNQSYNEILSLFHV